jgi:hypothetical protein
MKINTKLGGILALVGALIGIIGHYVLLMNWYQRGMAAESAEPGCEILLNYTMPALFDLGILGGVLYAVSSYGFFTRKNWAFLIMVIAIVLSLQGAWFINVPFMSANLPPVYFILFWPFLILFFITMWLVGDVPWGRILLAFVTGMAYVFCLMNGIASLSRIITVGAPIFVAVQRLHWVAMIGLGVITVGIILKPMEWMRVTGLASVLLELVVGIPLAFVTAVNLGRFSLFSLAPIASLVLLVILAWPGVWDKITRDKQDLTESPDPRVSVPA